jgi:hypothetical protein
MNYTHSGRLVVWTIMLPKQVQFLEADLKDASAQEAYVHRLGEDPGAGKARGSLGAIQRAGRCWSTQLRKAEVAYT